MHSAEIVRLYVDERLTLNEIARRYGCATLTVARRLDDVAIARRPRGPAPRRPTTASLQWTADLAWSVGIIATDGNLSPDGRHLSIVSKDHDLLETARRCLDIKARVTADGNLNPCYRLQWGDRVLYDWLLTLALMPKKSLLLGPLAIPDQWFRDFVRGCIDGDGSITRYTDRYHATKNERYIYERLWISLVSASPLFITWVRDTVMRLHGTRGSVSMHTRTGRSPIWTLKYGKRAALELIEWIYYAPDIACLERKRLIAEGARKLCPDARRSV